jgi:hypothetical protein
MGVGHHNYALRRSTCSHATLTRSSNCGRRPDRTLQFYEQQLAVFGVDNSAELLFAFLASQAVALESTRVDDRNDRIPILDQIAAIRHLAAGG